MRYLALACDYDGTIAHHGKVDRQTMAALERVRSSGRKLLLVTGRELDDLITLAREERIRADEESAGSLLDGRGKRRLEAALVGDLKDKQLQSGGIHHLI